MFDATASWWRRTLGINMSHGHVTRGDPALHYTYTLSSTYQTGHKALRGRRDQWLPSTTREHGNQNGRRKCIANSQSRTVWLLRSTD